MEEKENIIRRKGKGKEMKGAKSFLKKGYRWKNDVRDVCMYTSTFSNTSTPLSLLSTFHTSILNFDLSLPFFLVFHVFAMSQNLQWMWIENCIAMNLSGGRYTANPSDSSILCT